MNYLIEEIQELKKEGIILNYQEGFDYLRFLVVFSMGYTRYGITPNIFEEAIPEYVSALSSMKYGHDVITRMVTQISTQADTLVGKLSYKKIEL
jgi:hypothetical protein